MSESHLNEYGVEVSTRRIFSWDEFDMFHWDDDGLNGQIISGEQMHLIRATYAPGSTYPMHSHPHEQFSLLLSGRMRLTVGGKLGRSDQETAGMPPLMCLTEARF